ncbi:MAG: hypothetical protein U0992_11275 [Planctomycetaceae bacterium]
MPLTGRAKATFAFAGEQTLAGPLLQSLAQEPARPLLDRRRDECSPLDVQQQLYCALLDDAVAAQPSERNSPHNGTSARLQGAVVAGRWRQLPDGDFCSSN